jgi:hypothetical protein
MSRMAKGSTSIRMVLLILVACLAVHFLVEDLAQFNRAGTASTIASLIEQNHLDDLVVPATLPVQISVSHPWVMIPMIFASQAQAFFPILLPPKL